MFTLARVLNCRAGRGGTMVMRVWGACAAALVVVPGAAAAHPFTITDKSFRCISEMTHVRHFYVGNFAGNLKGTVKVAQSPPARTIRSARYCSWCPPK